MKAVAFAFLACLTTLAAEPPKLTEAMRADLRLMRERVPHGTGAYPSGNAIDAAQRVFAALPLVGMTRQDVIGMLGDPTASPTPAQMSYRFDGGYGGWEYLLTLDTQNRVTKVTRNGIN
jgi:hypothetical protein